MPQPQKTRKHPKQPSAPPPPPPLPHSPPHKPQQTLPLDLQQLILNLFQQTFPFSSLDDLKSTIQTVKGHLYTRNFDLAFGQPGHREAYALRWSASRALAYAHIFNNELSTFLNWDGQGETAAQPADGRAGEQPRVNSSSSCYTVVCLGGGAGAELVALASLLHSGQNGQGDEDKKNGVHALKATAVDVADWSDLLLRLQAAVRQPPALPKYASAEARASMRPLAPPDRWQADFLHRDVLHMARDELAQLLAPARLCTIMFTLNELFAASVARTTALLLQITECMAEGSYLLVVDSPGSYSEVRLGQQADKARQYPMKWLLDHALLGQRRDQGQGQGQGGPESEGRWVKVLSEDSRWFRLSPGLKYPLDLENMRYQIHLYRRARARSPIDR